MDCLLATANFQPLIHCWKLRLFGSNHKYCPTVVLIGT